MKVVHKAVAALVRDRGLGSELLVFRHPLAEVQLPKGTVEPGEAYAAAALRELHEDDAELRHLVSQRRAPRRRAGPLADGPRFPRRLLVEVVGAAAAPGGVAPRRRRGDGREAPGYRKRSPLIVGRDARQVRLPGEDAVFAPTPPLESLRMILSHATTRLPGERPKAWDPASPDRQMLFFIDISRAYFNAKVSDDEPVYVEFPPEMNMPKGSCALLRRHMYGTRRAADGWQSE